MRSDYHGWMRPAFQVASWLGAFAWLEGACFYAPTGSNELTLSEPSTGSETSSTSSADATTGVSTSAATIDPTTTQGPPAPQCSDGKLDPGEQCDDGNDIDGDGCEADCTKTPQCGDGELAPGEMCDDGNDIDGDGCDNSCTKSLICGDGELDPGEQCDDGNDIDEDACLASCIPAICGDAIHWTGAEGCDDGPLNGTYGACTADCSGLGERCGDGVMNGPEECDDGNATDDDACNDACIAPRLVFTTKYKYYGDLGGLDGADAKCGERALEAGLPEAVWRAWLSDDQSSPSMRFDLEFSGRYQLVDGTTVAQGWAGLSTGSLLHPIDLDEDGQPLSGDQKYAWTNTAPSGEIYNFNNNCYGWTAGVNGGTNGRMGDSTAIDATWTSHDLYLSYCGNPLRLYCFQNSSL